MVVEMDIQLPRGERRVPTAVPTCQSRLGKAPAPATDAGANRGLLKGGAVSGLKPGKEASMIQRQWLAAVPVAAWPMLCQQQRPSKRKAHGRKVNQTFLRSWRKRPLKGESEHDTG